MADALAVVNLHNADQRIRGELQGRCGLSYGVGARIAIGVRGTFDVQHARVDLRLKLLERARGDGIASEVPERLGMVKEFALAVEMRLKILPIRKAADIRDGGLRMVA